MGKLGGWPFVLSFEEMEQGAGRVSFPLGLLTTWNWGMNRRKWRCSGDRVLPVSACRIYWKGGLEGYLHIPRVKVMQLSGFPHCQEMAEGRALWPAALPAASSLQASPWHEACLSPEPSEQQGFNYYNVRSRGPRPSGRGENRFVSSLGE